jgi:hypothetical protein
MKLAHLAVAAVVSAAGVASATPTLQLDVNTIHIQCQNGQGQNSAFGGLSHTGSVNFSFQANTTVLNGVFLQTVVNGPFQNQNFNGSLSNFTGQITLSNGLVTGGHLGVFVNAGSDSYQCDVVPNVGHVSTYVGGGFKIEGLTFHGAFSDSQFGNVNVSAFTGTNLPGSFLQFNFDPNASGAGFADMDMFVDSVVPLPPAAWAGLGTLAGLMAIQAVRRRRQQA